ncbi:hypothetical protein BN946_scf184453.g1, partial [Trametes cinnabarina]
RTLSSVELGYPSSSAGGAQSSMSMASSPERSVYDWRTWMPSTPVVAPTASVPPAPREGVPHIVTTSREAERIHLLAYLSDLLNDRAQVESTLHSALAAGLDASSERDSLEVINARIELAREAIQHVNDAIQGRDQPMEADDYGLQEGEEKPTGEGSRGPSREPSRQSSLSHHTSAASAMSTPPWRERTVHPDSRAPTTSPQASSSRSHPTRHSTSAMPPPTAMGALSSQRSGGVERLRYGAAAAPTASHQQPQPPAAGPSHLGASTSQAVQAAPTWTVATPLWTTSESESEQIDELQSDTPSVAPRGRTRNVGRGSRR